MDASKFGWRAPSDACLDEIARRWPHDVQVVVDACQMRITRERLNTLLGKGFMVLITGSKFFTGPPFSGALLVPKRLSARLSGLWRVPEGLGSYTSQYDWPPGWALGASLPAKPNIGQWLRWEAALEEMRLYFSVPGSARDHVLAGLAGGIERLIAASPQLALLPLGIGGNDTRATIFSFIPHRHNIPLSPEETSRLYRALGHDLSDFMPADFTQTESARQAAMAPCQIGQPVALPDNRAALRIGLSARIVRNCWSAHPATLSSRVAAVISNAATVVQKLNVAIANIDKLA
jgi:hypothetical protein